MTTNLTQALVGKLHEDHPQGAILYDATVPGLRVVVGKKASSFKLMGKINNPGGTYVTVTLGRTDQVSLKTARAEAQAIRLKLSKGEDPRRVKTEVPTLAQALERYLDSRPDLSPRTKHWYREKVEGSLKKLKNTRMDAIDRETVRALHERITRTSGAYGANGAMRVLKLLLNDTARTFDLPPNVVTRAVKLNKETPRDWAVAPNDMPTLWKALDGMEDRVRRCCWIVMLVCGLRSGDARSMKWEHIDADGVLTVPSPKGGEAKAFKLPLPRFVRQELEEIRALTRPLCSPFVFASPTAKSGHIEQMCRTTTFDYAPHGMRHTFRTFAMEAGVDVGMTMILMNHRPAGVTWNYVTRANLLGPMRDAIETIAGKIVSYRGA
ncbi:hypothetical protein LCGC14_1523090 [marine sediment metagenome]|uniref:Tyr recombinase domain-containing protein n=1 Tax=marine sediment metagenome TaxID=412755 RepID=A0A0F9JJ06_9ZZZZ|tara:strand:- start:14667 stop:15806 length:1140 start_codon:yes stop_codon:yes gene_type:complete